MPPLLTAILRSWASQRDYAARLVADLSDADMVTQPVRGITMNHPAWTFGHLGAYTPVLIKVLREEPFEDPIKHPFGRDSKPQADPGVYPTKGTLMGAYFADHDTLDKTIRAIDPAVFAKPTPLARWVPRWPLIADAVVHLMIDHESTHLGQVSAWRRAGGRPPV